MASHRNPNEPATPPAPDGALRVLVVEDETLLSLSLEAMLEDWGHEQVGSAATGAEAIRLARETGPDVVLMDINLAGDIDGLTAAGRIRDFSEARIVFMTAYSDKDLASMNGGAAPEVLHKPFSPRLLQSILAEIEPAAAAARLATREGRNGAGQGR